MNKCSWCNGCIRRSTTATRRSSTSSTPTSSGSPRARCHGRSRDPKGHYRGHKTIAEYFMHCLAEVDDLRVEVNELVTAGDRVVAFGFECGRARRTGQEFRARFAQIWTTAGDKVKRLEGYPDTAVMVAAFEPA